MVASLEAARAVKRIRLASALVDEAESQGVQSLLRSSRIGPRCVASALTQTRDGPTPRADDTLLLKSVIRSILTEEGGSSLGIEVEPTGERVTFLRGETETGGSGVSFSRVSCGLQIP